MPLRKSARMKTLGAVPLFSGCTNAELARVAMVTDEITVPEGTVLMTEGQPGREFYVILEGSVRVTKKGRKVGDFGPGDHIGDVALVTDLPRIASGRTTATTTLLVLSDAAFRELIHQMPSIAIKVLKSVGERLHSVSV